MKVIELYKVMNGNKDCIILGVDDEIEGMVNLYSGVVDGIPAKYAMREVETVEPYDGDYSIIIK